MFDKSYSDNQKRLWSLVKRLRKKYEPITTLYADDNLKTTPILKAEALSFIHFLQRKIATPVISSQYPNMTDIILTTNGIQKLLQDLKPGKSVGPDNIPTWIVKVCVVQITPILPIIFTQTYDSGTLSNDWFTANIIPIYRNGIRVFL